MCRNPKLEWICQNLLENMFELPVQVAHHSYEILQVGNEEVPLFHPLVLVRNSGKGAGNSIVRIFVQSSLETIEGGGGETAPPLPRVVLACKTLLFCLP